MTRWRSLAVRTPSTSANAKVKDTVSIMIMVMTVI